MKAVLLALLVCAPSTASAEPIVPHFDNLYVDVGCADFWANPEHGLQVTVDGVVQEPRGENGVPVIGFTTSGPYSDWVPTDISYYVPPGTHDIGIDAPGCAPSMQQIVFGLAPVYIAGRLPVTDDSLRGSTGAPDGFGVLLGAYNQQRGPHLGNRDLFGTQFAYDNDSATGVWLSTSYEHRGLAFALDLLTGGGSMSGTATTANGTPAFTGSTLEMGGALRLGGRLRFGNLALSAGAGVGGSLWIAHADMVAGTNSIPNEADGDWYVPVWSTLTYKPSCNWGAQVLAQYQLHPGSTNEDAPTIGAGLLWQPVSACSDRVGIVVRG